MNKVFVGKLNVVTVYIAWIGFVLFLPLLFLSTIYSLNNFIALSPLAVGLLFGFFHFILAFFVRCPHCSKCLTIQGFKPPHPKSDGDWSKVIVKWFSGSVVCIYCGKTVDTNGI